LKSMTLLSGKRLQFVISLFHNFLGPNQSLWAKSENLLRSASHVLGTAKFFLSQTYWVYPEPNHKKSS
jgi:hypothetical protein